MSEAMGEPNVVADGTADVEMGTPWEHAALAWPVLQRLVGAREGSSEPEDVYQSLAAAIDQMFRDAIARFGATEADAMRYPIVALADQLVAAHLSPDGGALAVGSPWISTLERRFYGSNDAGDQLTERLSQLLAAPAPRIGLLWTYATCLALGYTEYPGRGPAGDDAQLGVLRDQAERALASLRPVRSIARVRASRPPAPPRRRPIRLLLGVCLIAFAVGWITALDEALSERTNHVIDALAEEAR